MLNFLTAAVKIVMIVFKALTLTTEDSFQSLKMAQKKFVKFILITSTFLLAIIITKSCYNTSEYLAILLIPNITCLQKCQSYITNYKKKNNQ